MGKVIETRESGMQLVNMVVMERGTWRRSGREMRSMDLLMILFGS